MILNRNRFDQEATLKAFIGHDGRGSPSYSDPETIECYVQKQMKLVSDNSGEEIVSNTQIYTPEIVKELDTITFEESERKVRAVEKYYRGNYTLVVAHL